MKDLTMIYSYYDNPAMFKLQQHMWRRYPQEIKDRLHFIIVDDCSPRWPAYNYIEVKNQYPINLYHTDVDIPWNMDHSRNYAADKAETRWLLLSDMDHVISVENIEKIFDLFDSNFFNGKHFYTFSRVDAPLNSPNPKYHPNSYIMERDMYWKVGGYDEEFAGFYGTDGHFRRGLLFHGFKEHRLNDIPLIRYPREVIPDASTTAFDRKKGRDKAQGRKYRSIADNKRKQGIKPKVLSFPVTKVI